MRNGPLPPAGREAGLATARSLAGTATLRRRAGRPDPGLEMLVAVLFLNAGDLRWSRAYAERATRGEPEGDRLGLARVIDGIATSYGRALPTGAVAELESLASRLGAPTLSAWSGGTVSP